MHILHLCHCLITKLKGGLQFFHEAGDEVGPRLLVEENGNYSIHKKQILKYRITADCIKRLYSYRTSISE